MSSSPELAVRVESLTKRFGEMLAVDDLSFDLERGTITGFLGPNGAGDGLMGLTEDHLLHAAPGGFVLVVWAAVLAAAGVAVAVRRDVT